jgi:Uma2 family endonuclease
VTVAPGLIFAEDDNVAPDIVWISNSRLAAARDAAGHLHAAPELVVEVVSPGVTNERRDLELKLKLYSRQGVHEYWIVDWRLRTVQVYRQHNLALALVSTAGDGDTLTSPLLPGFAMDVDDIWEPAS